MGAETRPRERIAPPFRAEGVPVEMKTFRSWVVWRFEKRGEKSTKVPYDPATGRRASSTDMRTWRSFDEAVQAFEAGRYDGVGFVFSTGDPFAGIDLDGCRDPETGAIEAWAEKIVERLDGYAEVSPSGTGVHVVVRGKASNKRRGPLEMYSSERFFTVTGEVLR